jgi:hypothetical protein
MACCHATRVQDPLYVVLPYFNFCGFRRRRQLFIEFVNRIAKTRGIRIVISEALGSEPLPDMPVWHHVKVQTSHPIWIKENLVNLGVSEFPHDWKYMAWVDADLTFLNVNWVMDTLTELESYDIVQLFQTAVNLGSTGESLKIDKSFGYMHRDSGTPYTKTDRYGFWHPGYGWACTRKAFEQMNGLIDWAILGSGDRHMALAWIGRVKDSAPGNINPNYMKLLSNYQKVCKGLEVSYVPGTILHHWHGSFENRRYRERWEILTKNNFDPFLDISVTDSGVACLTRRGLRFAKDLQEYFTGRREDS